MSVRVPPYKNTLGAGAFVVVFAPIYYVAVAMVWWVLLIALSYVTDFRVSAENVVAFRESHALSLKMGLLVYVALATFLAALIVAVIFRRANLKAIVIFYVGYSFVIGLFLLTYVPLIGDVLLGGSIGLGLGGAMLYQHLNQLAPPPNSDDGTSPDGPPGAPDSFIFVARDTTKAKRVRRIVGWILFASLLILAIEQVASEDYVAAVVLLAIGIALILMLRHASRKLETNPPRLEIGPGGLAYGGGILPWAAVGQAWIHKHGRYATLRVAASPEAGRAFLDKNRPNASIWSALIVRLQQALAGISSVAVPLVFFEATADEILNAIEQARPGG